MSSNTSSFRPDLLAALAVPLALLSVPGKAAQSEMTAQSATQIIEGCAAHAKTRGQSHAIVVVDGGGRARRRFVAQAQQKAAQRHPEVRRLGRSLLQGYFRTWR